MIRLNLADIVNCLHLYMKGALIMNPIIKPETINILGGQKEAGSFSNESSHSEPPHKETLCGKIKSKIKKVWAGILSVAEDIKEKIIPVIVPTITAFASILKAVAVFRNSGCRYGQKRDAQCWA